MGGTDKTILFAYGAAVLLATLVTLGLWASTRGRVNHHGMIGHFEVTR